MALYNVFKLIRRLVDGNISFRRALLLGVLACCCLLYVGPVLLRWLFSARRADPHSVIFDKNIAGGACIRERVAHFEDAVRSFDAVVSVDDPGTLSATAAPPPQLPFNSHQRQYWQHAWPHHRHLAYVGNGHLSVVLSAPPGDRPPLSSVEQSERGVDSLLLIRGGDRTLNVRVPFRPVAIVELLPDTLSEPAAAAAADYEDVSAASDASAVLVHFRDALVQRVQCHTSPRRSLQTVSTVYAHRRTPALLVQHVRLHNPGPADVRVRLTQPTSVDWPDVSKTTGRLPSFVGGGDSVLSGQYSTVTGVIELNDSLSPLSTTTKTASAAVQRRYIAVVVAVTVLPHSVTVPASSVSHVLVVSAVNYTEPAATSLEAQRILRVNGMVTSTVNTLVARLADDRRELLQSHVAVWRRLWMTGVSISRSLADDALNGDAINATIYYVLSQARAPLHEQQPASAANQWELRARLQNVEGCYGDRRPTLYTEPLWSSLHSLAEVLHTTRLWLLLLEKKGCHNVLEAGADGVMQAMVLSMGALTFSNRHLELGMEPKDMHRNYTFRNVLFGNNTHLNVTVSVDGDNQAHLAVAVDTPQLTYYACDAGCLDQPVRLGRRLTELPVKRTDPPTAALYITADWQHLAELKHTIHVKEVSVAPPHDTQLMSLHRHGHSLGTLPTLFWLCVFVLIALFHLFLIKLIVNEYCPTDRPRTRKYSDYKDSCVRR